MDASRLKAWTRLHNKIDFLHKSTHYHEAQTLALQAEIDHLKELVGSREKLRELGRDLIEISDRFKFKDAMLRFEQKKDIGLRYRNPFLPFYGLGVIIDCTGYYIFKSLC